MQILPEITKEDVLDLAASKLANAFSDEASLSELAENLIRDKIEKLVAQKFEACVTEIISKEVEVLLSKEIVPIDVWGERCGSPTTIRAALHQRAKDFWLEKVNEDGKPCGSWGGTPRHEKLLKEIVKAEFVSAIRTNAFEIVKAFKAALLQDSQKLIAEHIEKLIPNR